MKPLSRSAAAVPNSGIREIFERAAPMTGVVSLVGGQPNFATPPHIVAAVHAALDAGHTTYISSAGIPELREAVAAKFQRESGVPTDTANTVVTSGAMAALAGSLFALLEPGDEVLLPDPGFPNYTAQAMLTGATIVPYPLRLDNDFLPDPNEVERLITPRTKAIMLCNPGNPTGQVFGRTLIEEIVALAQKHDLYVISDEIYQDLIFEGEHVNAASLDPDRSIVISGVSKSYAMTGFRVGFLRAPRPIAKLVEKLQQPFVSCGVAISQYGALAAITGPQDCVAAMRQAYRRRRDLAVEALKARNAHTYTPRGAFYVLIDVSASGLDGHAFALKLLDQKRVSVAPGPTFGEVTRDYVRVSLASSEADIETGINAIFELTTAAVIPSAA